MNKYQDRYLYEVPEPYLDIDFLYRQAGWSMNEHTHPYYQSILVTDGVLLLTVEGCERKLVPGSCCIIPPACPHSLRTEYGYFQLGINLQTEHDRRGLLRLLEGEVSRYCSFDRLDLVEEIRLLERESMILSAITLQKLAQLADRVLLRCLEEGEGQERLSGGSFREAILRILEERISGEKPALGEITRRMAMSQTQLERLANREFGCSVMELYQRIRISKACILLRQSEDTLDSIASQLGFYDQAHLYRAFKKRMGIGPREYRKLKQAST